MLTNELLDDIDCQAEAAGYGLADPEAQAWPAPAPLPGELPPVDRFTPELLPEALRDWIGDISYRMQCPPDFAAIGALVAISSLIGARAVVQPKARDTWQVTPNLWGCAIGRAGVKKTPALKEVLRPLHHLQDDARQAFEAESANAQLQAEVQKMMAEARRAEAAKSLKSSNCTKEEALEILKGSDSTPTPPPTMRRFVVNDSTVEKLQETLRDNPHGVLSTRDELAGLLLSLDKTGQEEARSFYLSAYDGDQPYTAERIGRGTVHVDRACVALLGGIQPGKIAAYVNDALRGGDKDDGLLQRFSLAVWPDVCPEVAYIDQPPNYLARDRAMAVFDRLAQLKPGTDGQPVVWRLADDAREDYIEWSLALDRELRGESLHPALVSHLSKYHKTAPALALIFALIDTPDAGEIGRTELLRAFEFVEYLRSHAERLYSSGTNPGLSGAWQLLAKLRTGKLCDSGGARATVFTPRQVAQKRWAGLGDADAAHKAADVLAEYGWLRHETKPTSEKGGRPSEIYLVHPSLLLGDAL